MFLRQSTAGQEILLGPFLDDTDGKTAETGLTIANTDIKIWKEGGTTESSKNSGGATHIASGRYYTVLDATDSNTLGNLEVNVHVTGALPVRREFTVLAANVYDSLIAASDALQVDAIQVSGTTQTARDIGASVLLSSGTGTGQISLSSGAVTAGTVSDKTGYSLTQTFPTNFADLAITSTTGRVTVGTNNDKTGYSLTQTFPTNFADMSISATTGLVDITQAAADKAWSTTTRVLTANTNLNDPTAAAIADAVWDEAISGHLGVGSTGEALNGASAPTAAAVADAVWDEVLSGHLTVGSTGEALNAAGAAGDPWTTSLPGAYGAGSAGYIIGNNVNAPIATIDTVVDAIKVKTDYLPSATAGASGGVFIAGTNAATSITTALTANITGNLSGSVGSVTGAVGSVTGNVGGNVTGSVGSVTGGINTGAGVITTLDGLDTAQDTQHSTTQSNIAALNDPTAAAIADAVWDEATVGHTTAGTFGEQVKTDIDAILTDTNELQADWVNGGRLDLILDGRASQTTADAIEVDTQDIQSRIPAALVGGRIDSNVGAISTSTAAADNLESHALRTVSVTFSAGGTTTTAVLNLVDGSAASGTDDVYNGRVLVFSAPAALKDQGCTITDYTGSTKTATISAVTTSVDATAIAVLV